MTPQTGTDQQVRRWTIQADGPDGAVPHFYADTDLAEVEVLEAAPLLALLSGLADRWEERATKNAQIADALPTTVPFRMGLTNGAADTWREAASELRHLITEQLGEER
jgi:hypothetical protein